MIEAKLPNTQSRTESQLNCKCRVMRQLIEDGQYKYGKRVRGSDSDQAGTYSTEEDVFIEEHRDVLTATQLLKRMKAKFPESEQRTLKSMCGRLTRTIKKPKSKPSSEEIVFIEDHLDMSPGELLKRIEAKFPEGYKRTVGALRSKIANMKKKNSGGGSSSNSTTPGSRCRLREIRLRVRRSWRTKTTRFR
jgi:hypothetical protein